MNENINLCEILKGHEGEIFYSPIYGNMVLSKIDNRYPYPLYFDTNVNNKSIQTFNSDGKPDIFCDECLVFPSKAQRDWNKWDNENNHKVPKTWSEYINQFDIDSEPTLWFDSDINWDAIGNSCSALFKIHKLIEVGYGGTVTFDYIRKMPTYEKVWSIYYNFNVKRFETKCSIESIDNTILFHTKEQAEEFLSKSENVQLLKDYFMI